MTKTSLIGFWGSTSKNCWGCNPVIPAVTAPAPRQFISHIHAIVRYLTLNDHCYLVPPALSNLARLPQKGFQPLMAESPFLIARQHCMTITAIGMSNKSQKIDAVIMMRLRKLGQLSLKAGRILTRHAKAKLKEI